MANTTNETYVTVSASVGRMGPTSSIDAGIGADISYLSGSGQHLRHGHGQGQNPGRGQVTASPNDYCTYVWQAIGLASALAMSPFIVYGVWKASSFLCCHLRAFGWAWIICFIASLCFAIYMDNSTSTPQQYSQSQTTQIIQSDDAAMMDLLQRGGVISIGVPPFRQTDQPYQPTFQPTMDNSGPVAMVASSKPTPQTQAQTRPQPQALPPNSKNQSMTQMAATEGQGCILGDSPTMGGALLVTAVGGVFNADSATVTEIVAIE